MSDKTQRNDLLVSGNDRSFQSAWGSIKKKFGVLLDSIPDGIILTDAAGRIVLANSEAEKLFGYSSGELVSREIELLVPNSLREDHLEQRISHNNYPHSLPMGHRRTLFGHRKDRSEFLAEISLSPMQTNSGLLVCAVVRDVVSRRNSERILRLVVEGTSLAFGEDYFRLLVRHLADALEVQRAFISELHNRKFRLLASWNGNDFEEIFEYDAEGTPCEHVLKKGLVFYPKNVQQFFPEDQWLIDSHIESYLAIRLSDLDGRPIGLVGVAHDKPLPEVLCSYSIFQAISTRAGVELLRMRAEKSLRLANNELEDRVKERTQQLERANEQLRTESVERQWLTRIYKESPIGLCCFDKQLRYIDVNEWLATLNGISIDEHLGRRINEVLPDVAESVELQLRHVIETGEPIINGEVVAETPADPRVKKHFLHNYYPLKSDEGEIVGVSCAVQDITERKKTEENLETANQTLEDRVKKRTNELEISNEHYRTEMVNRKQTEDELRQRQSELTHAARLSTLGEMAAGLAHELNQPLTAISAFAEGALLRMDRRGKISEEEIVTLFSRIVEDSQRAGNIIKRLRNFVQKREPLRIQLELNPLVKDVYQLIESDAKLQDITIQLELENGLPAVVATPVEIQQVLLNLIRNACDAISQNDSLVRNIVISSCENNAGRVEVVVEDSGPGISSSMASQVFDPFYTSKPDGLGIGLGICKNIIETHRGTIWLGSSSMGGASVHFDFPSCQQESEINAL